MLQFRKSLLCLVGLLLHHHRKQPSYPKQTLRNGLNSYLSLPSPSIFFSALGTTKASAGSIEKQREIDHDLNLSVAQTAKQNGAKTFVLISANGANSNKSSFAYPKRVNWRKL